MTSVVALPPARLRASLGPASIGRRLAAFLVDRLCLVAVVAAFAGIGAVLVDLVPTPGEDRGVRAVVALAVVGLVAAGFGLGLLRGSDGTPGERLTGIRLRRIDGGPAGFGRVLWRGLVLAASSVVLLGVVSPLFERKVRRGWHDRASGTWMTAVPTTKGAHTVRMAGGDGWEFHSSILLGRDPEPADDEGVEVLARLGDGERSVSRTHALLTVQAAGIVVEDRGSSNGTTVVVDGAHQDVNRSPVVLLPGAIVRLGDLELIVDEPGR